MLFGALGFVAFALVVRPLLDHLHAVALSAIGLVVWATVAVGGYLLILGGTP